MTHLTVEEIIEFVSFDKLLEGTVALSAKVNEHIRSCPACLQKVSSFQMVYDELSRIKNVADVKQNIYRLIDEGKIKAMQETELNEEIQSSSEHRMNEIFR